jgi:signal transduction histidine kinase
MSMDRRSPSNEASHRYETIFCVFLLAVVFLYRDNPYLVYPNILYLFVALLSFNLAAGWVLRRFPTRPDVAAGIALGNCALITGIVTQSGGQDSNLWVLYLLPIYTVCLLMEGFQLVLIVMGIVSFNAVFHCLSTDRSVDATMMFNLSLKSGLFIFAAAVTWRSAQRDRRTRIKLADHRAEMERLENRLEHQQNGSVDDKRMADIGHAASGIAHDIAGPLTVVIGTAKMLLEDESTRAFHKDLERISRAAQLCETISSNVLSYARQQAVELTPCDLRTVVESALQIYEPLLVERGIRVERDFGHDLALITGSAAQLERVILNLLSNAKAAMPSGGQLKLRVEASSPRPFSPPWVQVVVEDSGPGISPEAFAKIFKPFNTTKAPGEGTGLGLYLCRQIAVQHNGRLHVENRPEGGARFILSLPSGAFEAAEPILRAA